MSRAGKMSVRFKGFLLKLFEQKAGVLISE
jgi:hypothetical protein